MLASESCFIFESHSNSTTIHCVLRTLYSLLVRGKVLYRGGLYKHGAMGESLGGRRGSPIPTNKYYCVFFITIVYGVLSLFANDDNDDSIKNLFWTVDTQSNCSLTSGMGHVPVKLMALKSHAKIISPERRATKDAQNVNALPHKLSRIGRAVIWNICFLDFLFQLE